MDSRYLAAVFVLLGTIFLSALISHRFRLGAVAGYLTAGALIGPFSFALIGDHARVLHFSEIGLVIMLFLIGLEIDPVRLWRMRGRIMALGGAQMLSTAAVLGTLVFAVGGNARAAIAAGLALALSSTAAALQALEERGLRQTPMGEAALLTLLFQDIAVIPVLAGLPLLAGAGADAPDAEGTAAVLREAPGWARAAITLGAAGGVVAAFKYGSHAVFHMTALTGRRELFTALSLAVVTGVTLLMEKLGISPALGAFVAGAALANSEYKHTLESDLAPFKGLLLGSFFISLGMGMDFNLLTERPVPLLACALGVTLVKAALLFLVGRMDGMPSRQSAGFALALCQSGEFSFVLFAYAAALGLTSPEEAKFLTMTAALSVFLAAPLMSLYGRFGVAGVTEEAPSPDYDTARPGGRAIVAGYGRFGQIIGRFLTARGVKVTILEKDPEQIRLLRRFGHKGYFGDATREDLLISAGARDAEALAVAVDDAETSLEIVRLARERFPGLKVFARARNRRHAYELHKAGAHLFKREMFDSALSMAESMLVALGADPTDVARKAELFRKHDEETLKASFAFFESETDMVSFSRLRSAELEQVLRSDVSESEREAALDGAASASPSP